MKRYSVECRIRSANRHHSDSCNTRMIDHKLVEIALQQVHGEDFERFANAMLSAITGIDYVPMGGVQDGGADAFVDYRDIFEAEKANGFFQASIQANHKEKIKHTVKRLRSVGRDPKSLTYVTAQSIKLLDLDEESLTEQTGVFVRIRDSKWIVANVNHSPATINAFQSYLTKYLAFLNHVGGSTLIESAHQADSHAVCVFLRQEVERRSGSGELEEPITDGLILWALEETDPDEGRLASKKDILDRIHEVLPTARHFIEDTLDERLQQLSSKGNPTGREVRWYRKEDLFCLPYETRTLVKIENVEDESLKARVMNRLEERAQKLDDKTSPRDAARVALRAIGLTFEARGLELAAFLERRVGQYEELYIADHVDTSIQELAIPGSDALDIRNVALGAIRGAFYESTDEERKYFSKLAKAYSLLFSLKLETRVVGYFQTMSSNLVLLVGTDILVRALTEHYLHPEDQMTCNLLKMLHAAGAELVLTQPVAEEVHSHVETSDREFADYFERAEHLVDLDVARQAPKILVRAYFYAKLSPPAGINGPQRWSEFIYQICDLKVLHSPRGREQIRKYLMERFGLTFMSDDELTKLSSPSVVESIADKLWEARPGRIKVLAENDAKMVLSVYGKRNQLREDHHVSPYGYRTWWLTHETTVRTVTQDLVEKHGAEYMMRPEFLADFIALSPSAQDVRNAYSSIFPTLLGIKMSNRVRDDSFHGFLRRVTEVAAVDEARARVLASEYSDRLKSVDFDELNRRLTTV